MSWVCRQLGLGWPVVHDAYVDRVQARVEPPATVGVQEDAAPGQVVAVLPPVRCLGIDETRRGKVRWQFDPTAANEDGSVGRWVRGELFETNLVCLGSGHGNGNGLLAQLAGRRSVDVAAFLSAQPQASRDGVGGRRDRPVRLLPEGRPRGAARSDGRPRGPRRRANPVRRAGHPVARVGDGGPSNHLLSSQVQCVNALGQMAGDPGRLARGFASVVDIGEVLEVEPGRFLTFEFIGPVDYFGESPGRPRVRGAGCTSVDAAFLHRAGDGVVELVLVEWKYTESYRLRTPDPARDQIRRARYQAAVDDPGGPIDASVLPFELLLDEPLYQLVRQQLLAHALETSGALGAGRARVVHVAPRANTAYQRSLHRPEHLAGSATVDAIWSRLLRHPDRFTHLDSAVFSDPDVTSAEYAARYARARTTATGLTAGDIV